MNGYVGLIDLAVVAGAGLVVPASLRRWREAWWAVAGSAALAASVAPGTTSGLLAAPWLGVALAALLVEVRRAWRDRRFGLDVVAALAAPAWAAVAGAALVDSCTGWHLSGVGEPIARLTVVHFTFAGVATTALARSARQAALGRCGARRSAGVVRVATAAVVTVLVAPPVVALGFLSGSAVAQVGGAVLMALGTYLLAAVHLHEGWAGRGRPVGRLLLVSGASVWVPMALAVAWAAAQHTGGPALSIPDMVRVHGSLNAVGFVGCGLLARARAGQVEQATDSLADAPGDPAGADGPVAVGAARLGA